MPAPHRREGGAGALPTVVLALVALHVLALAPALSRSFPADDTLLLVPAFLDGLEGRSAWDTFRYLFGVEQKLPRALWKVYVLLGGLISGPSQLGLVWIGVLLHAACSAQVWSLGRRLGLGARAAWAAVGLHFTAYLGCHAYLWPVGVQHVLTALGILAVLDLYLATDQRRRAGRPYRAYYWATVAVALLASLSRAPSLAAPLAVMAHAALAPGNAAERLRRYDLWWPAMLASMLYPVALLAYGGDAESLAGSPLLVALQRRLEWQTGRAAAFALGMAGVLGALVAGRLALRLAGRQGGTRGIVARPWARWMLAGAAALLAGPWVLRAALALVWGVETFFAPLGIALDGDNAARWHLVSFPVDLPGVGLAAAVLVLFLRALPSRADALLLAVPFVGFATMLATPEAGPLRYWIYVTPALAIAIAGAIDAGGRLLARAVPGRRVAAALLVVLCAVLALQNLAAVRLALWRHKLTDTYQALDYIRAADFIRKDLQREGRPGATAVCVDGFEPLPYEEAWHRWFEHRGTFHDHAARAILAQTLGRADASGLRLGCPDPPAAGERRYVVTGTTVRRAGRSIDPFERLDGQVRDLVAASDYRAARALLDGSSHARPFLIEYVLEALPDGDVVWLTNGASLSAWAARVADHHDTWYQRREPKIASLRALAFAETTAYARFLFLAHYVETRTAQATASWDPPSTRLPFRGLTMAELDTLVRSDPLVSADPAMQAVLDAIVTAPPRSPRAKSAGDPRATADPAFLWFVARLLVADAPGWSAAR